MSLPLTRRIARAALLVAAGAAAGVGAAGSASAAPELPAAPTTAGLTSLDGASVGNTVDGAAQNVTGLAGEAGSNAVKKAVPNAGKTGGSVAKKAAPAAQRAAGAAAGSVGEIVGVTTQTASQNGGALPSGPLAKGSLPSTGNLPVKGLPIGG